MTYMLLNVWGWSAFAKPYFCSMRFGHRATMTIYHWMDVNLRMRILGLGKATEVKPLSEDAAVELGSEIISESFLFVVAVGTLTFEYWRSSKKEERHESEQSVAIRELQSKVEDLGLTVEQQDAKLRELNRLVVLYAPSSEKKK